MGQESQARVHSSSRVSSIGADFCTSKLFISFHRFKMMKISHRHDNTKQFVNSGSFVLYSEAVFCRGHLRKYFSFYSSLSQFHYPIHNEIDKLSIIIRHCSGMNPSRVNTYEPEESVAIMSNVCSF